jgi:hypothetical protein
MADGDLIKMLVKADVNKCVMVAISLLLIVVPIAVFCHSRFVVCA